MVQCGSAFTVLRLNQLSCSPIIVALVQEKMTAKGFFLSPKMGNDLLLAASGEKVRIFLLQLFETDQTIMLCIQYWSLSQLVWTIY